MLSVKIFWPSRDSIPLMNEGKVFINWMLSREGQKIFTDYTGGSGHLSAIDKAPHPNAAKVFINWLLSREGQKIFTDFTSTNSRRLDVTGPSELAPDTSAKYVCQQHMRLIEVSDKAMDIAKELLQ